MTYKELEVLAKTNGFKLDERQIPNNVPQLVLLRPDGFEQVFNKDNKSFWLRLAEYEISNYQPFFNYAKGKKQKFSLSEVFNVKNIKNLVTGTINQYKEDLNIGTIPEYQSEQFNKRLDICEKCVHFADTGNKKHSCNKNILSLNANGRLAHGCGCDFPGLTKAPDKICPLGKWHKILDENNWNNFKNGNPIVNTLPKMASTIRANEDPDAIKQFIQCDTVANLGVVKVTDNPIETVFKLKNISNLKLKVTSVATSCQCTSPKYTANILNPGDTGEIILTYNPKGKMGTIAQNGTVTFSEVIKPNQTKLFKYKLVLNLTGSIYKPNPSITVK